MSKKEKPAYGLVRKGNALVPASNYDLAALDGIAQGEMVSVDIKQFRNNLRLRAYFAMLREVIDACDLIYSSENCTKLSSLRMGWWT